MKVEEMLKLKSVATAKDIIVNFIKDSVKNFAKDGVVIGLSGGIDSSVVAYLACEALGKDKVLALFMPERDSNPLSRSHAKLVSRNLGMELLEINLTPILRRIGIYKLEPSPLFFPRSFQEKYVLIKYKRFQDEETTFLKSQKGGEGNTELMRGVAFLRIKHRLRMIMWYCYAELRNYLVLGCCNKTEKLTGYFVKYGDSGSDIDPIAGLYKTQVSEIARFIGVPEEIVNKPPSPDLMPGMTDEFALQMSYKKIDTILYALENQIEEDRLIQEGIKKEEIDYIKTLFDISRHMREIPPFPSIDI